MSPIREFEQVSYGFLKFYSEADPIIKIMGFEDPVDAMDRYARNPGHLVQVIRKTEVFLEGEMISVKVAREVFQVLLATPPEVIKHVDKTKTGFVIWDLIKVALDYFRIFAAFHYKVDIFDRYLDIEAFENRMRKGQVGTQSGSIGPGKLLSDTVSFSKERNSSGKGLRRENTCQNLKTSFFHQNSRSHSRSPVKNSKPKQIIINNTNSNCKQATKAYEEYISEKFQTFLIEKINSNELSEENWNEKRAGLLEEFNFLIELLDNDWISELWQVENFSKEASQLISRLQNKTNK